MHLHLIALVIISWLTPSTIAFLSLNPLRRWLGIESCDVRNADAAVESLQSALNAELFGQHLAKKTVLVAIKVHLDEPSPNKALVLSLHGWSGAGKTFTSQLIVKSLFEKGEKSSYFRFFSASFHFPDPLKVREYREWLLEEVKKTVRSCERALFIFDEVDKLPEGVLDVLTPLIKPIGRLEEGLNVKKSIFIFLSNSGATKINEITQNAKLEGRARQELQLKDFEEVLSNEAFGTDGGLYKSELIEKILVDWFVPFLPLEREHVKSCVWRDVNKMGAEAGGFKGWRLNTEQLEGIANRLSYWPEDKRWFSVTGCKRVESLVKFYIMEAKLRARGKNEL